MRAAILLPLALSSCLPMCTLRELMAPAPAQLPYAPAPTFRFEAMGHYATGLALADLDGDGYKDMIVANGNDQAPQHVVAYRYDPGSPRRFDPKPTWRSRDIGYHGKIAVGDIDKDGLPDVAVSVMLGESGTLGAASGGKVKVYFNRSGQLEALPSYETGDSFASFSCALGDADGDGDLDLAVATMGDGDTVGGPARIYFNENGALAPTPGWVSDDLLFAGDIGFADMNQDGLLDLLVAAPQARIYYASPSATGGAALETTPSFVSKDGSTYAYAIDAGRVGDGSSLALLVSYNDFCWLIDQPCGKSRFELYRPIRGSEDSRSPVWRSKSGGLGAGALLADLNQDGNLDLVAGRWGVKRPDGAPLEIYLGDGQTLATTPEFTSDKKQKSVIQSIAVADLAHTALKVEEVDVVVPEGATPRRVITLPRQVIDHLEEVRRGDAALPREAYTSVPGRSWISFAQPLLPGDVVHVRYVYSDALDIAVANFDCDIGEYIFYRTVTFGPVPRHAKVLSPHLTHDEGSCQHDLFSVRSHQAASQARGLRP